MTEATETTETTMTMRRKARVHGVDIAVYGYREPSLKVIENRIVKAASALGRAYKEEWLSRESPDVYGHERKMDVRAYRFGGTGFRRGVEIQVSTSTARGGVMQNDGATTARIFVYPDRTYSIDYDYGFPRALLEAFKPE